MLTRTIAALATTILLLAITSCANAPMPADDAVPAELRATGIRYLRMPMENVYTAGQPTREQLAQLSAAGVRRVLHLRLANERGTGWEEQAAPELRLEFVRLPIKGAAGLTPQNVRMFAAKLAEGNGQPTLVSCGSSNRVGALFALKAYWLDGKTPAEALAIGKAAGMTRLTGATETLLAEPRPTLR